MKNALDGHNSKLDNEKKISEHKDKTMKTTQAEA